MSTPKLHNNILSMSQSAPADSPGATPRQPIGTAQEAVGPSPGPDLSPDARDISSRKTSRGPASPDALLRAPDACGNLPQKKTRTPAPARQERSRRGRPNPQNRDGSGNAGQAEGSLPRLAPEGQDIEQEIALLRSLANRLLSRRPINYPYLFRCLNLIARCTTVKARYFNNESDEEIDKIAAGFRRLWESIMADGILGYRELLPLIMASPGKDLARYDNLLPIHPELLDSLLEVKDAWEREHGSPFVDNPNDDEEPPPFGMRPLPPHLYQPPDDYLYDEAPPPSPSVIPPPEPESTTTSVIPDSDRESIPRGGAAPAEAETYPPAPPPDPPSSFSPIEIGGPHYEEMDPFPSPADATGHRTPIGPTPICQPNQRPPASPGAAPRPDPINLRPKLNNRHCSTLISFRTAVRNLGKWGAGLVMHLDIHHHPPSHSPRNGPWAIIPPGKAHRRRKDHGRLQGNLIRQSHRRAS